MQSASGEHVDDAEGTESRFARLGSALDSGPASAVAFFGTGRLGCSTELGVVGMGGDVLGEDASAGQQYLRLIVRRKHNQDGAERWIGGRFLR